MIVGILGPGGCGGTFLDWSLQYLSGQESHWIIQCVPQNRSTILKQGSFKISENPLSAKNAHKHLKTHPNDQSIGDVINFFKSQSGFDLNSFYYVDSMSAGRTQTNHNQIIAQNPEIKFINYNFTNNDVDMIFCLQYEKMGNHTDIIPTSFLELPLWDQRELLSLYYPKLIQGQTTVEKINPMTNVYQLNFGDMVENLDIEIKNIFQYLGLTIKEIRLESWKQIYIEWKRQNNLDFFKNLGTIIQCILNNSHHDFSQYSMSFAKEVVIASKLLYNHDLSLKSYKKNNLSQNTKQWTELLEPNIYHNLTNNRN